MRHTNTEYSQGEISQLYEEVDITRAVENCFGPEFYFTGPILEDGQWCVVIRHAQNDDETHKLPAHPPTSLTSGIYETGTLPGGRVAMSLPPQDVASRRIIPNLNRTNPEDDLFIWEVTLKDGTLCHLANNQARPYWSGMRAYINYHRAHPASHLPVPATYPTHLHAALKHIEKRMLAARPYDSGFSYKGFQPHADGTLLAWWDSWGTTTGFDVVPAVLVAEAEELLTTPE